MVYSTIKKEEFFFPYFPRYSNVQVTYVRARTICTHNSGYNVPYFTSKQSASRTFPPPPGHLFLAGQTGLLSCSYSSCIYTFRVYQRGWRQSYWRDPVQHLHLLFFHSRPVVQSLRSTIFYLFFDLFFPFFYLDLVSFQCE